MRDVEIYLFFFNEGKDIVFIVLYEVVYENF